MSLVHAVQPRSSLIEACCTTASATAFTELIVIVTVRRDKLIRCLQGNQIRCGGGGVGLRARIESIQSQVATFMQRFGTD